MLRKNKMVLLIICILPLFSLAVEAMQAPNVVNIEEAERERIFQDFPDNRERFTTEAREILKSILSEFDLYIGCTNNALEQKTIYKRAKIILMSGAVNIAQEYLNYYFSKEIVGNFEGNFNRLLKISFNFFLRYGSNGPFLVCSLLPIEELTMRDIKWMMAAKFQAENKSMRVDNMKLLVDGEAHEDNSSVLKFAKAHFQIVKKISPEEALTSTNLAVIKRRIDPYSFVLFHATAPDTSIEVLFNKIKNAHCPPNMVVTGEHTAEQWLNAVLCVNYKIMVARYADQNLKINESFLLNKLVDKFIKDQVLARKFWQNGWFNSEIVVNTNPGENVTVKFKDIFKAVADKMGNAEDTLVTYNEGSLHEIVAKYKEEMLMFNISLKEVAAHSNLLNIKIEKFLTDLRNYPQAAATQQLEVLVMGSFFAGISFEESLQSLQ